MTSHGQVVSPLGGRLCNLTVCRYDAVVEVRLNRPAKRNAVTMQMFADLASILDWAAECDSVRALVLSGEGDTFCAGHDLQEFSAWPQQVDDPVPRFLKELALFRKPLVMAVQGAAAGIGFTSSLYADWVCCTENAMFIAPFMKLGIAPEAASTLMLAKQVGLGRAKQILLGGRYVEGTQAVDWGLASEIVDRVSLLPRALEVAGTMAQYNSTLFQSTKRLMLPPESTLLERVQVEVDLINKNVLDQRLSVAKPGAT